MSPCVLPSSPTLSFRSYWLTTERRQARWQVASSYKPPRAKPLKSFTVSKKTTWRPDFFKESSWHSYIINFFFYLIMISDFIKVERDDHVASKGKGGGDYKWENVILWPRRVAGCTCCCNICLSPPLTEVLRLQDTISRIPATWDCPTEVRTWSKKAGVTACRQRIFQAPENVVMMPQHAVTQSNLTLCKCVLQMWPETLLKFTFFCQMKEEQEQRKVKVKLCCC